jgi:hypothetical protein
VFLSGDATLPIPQLLGDIEIEVVRASLRDVGVYLHFAVFVCDGPMARGGWSGTISREPKLGVIDYAVAVLIWVIGGKAIRCVCGSGS